jgi:hypothetical protein
MNVDPALSSVMGLLSAPAAISEDSSEIMRRTRFLRISDFRHLQNPTAFLH